MSVKRLTPHKIANLVMADDAWHDSEYVAAADYDAAVARIAELEAERDDLLRWKEDAVRLCAQRCCATRDARLIDAEARAERAEADAEIGRKWRADSSLETWFPSQPKN